MTTDRLTDTELDAIRERLAAATPGPWRMHAYGSPADEEPIATVIHTGVFDWHAVTYDGDYLATLDAEAHIDADFIAHAPTDIAALLDEVERLRAERAQMTEVQEWVGTPDAQEPWRMAYRLQRRLVGPWLPVEDGDQP